MNLEKEIKEILKREKNSFFPKWVKPEEIDNLILENIVVYISKGELRSFARIDVVNERVLELDWFWIKDKGRGRVDEYFFIFWLLARMVKYAEKVYSNFFEGVYTPVVKFSKRKIQRYLTAYRFNSPVFNPSALPENVEWNGIYAYHNFGNNFVGYSRLAYDLFADYGVPFLVLDLPIPPLGRDYQLYYEVEVDRDAVLEKYKKVSKRHKLKGELKLLNFKLLNLIGD